MALDRDTWDIVIDKGVSRIDEVEYVAQLVRSRLLVQQGEWFRDRATGLPWFSGILGSSTTGIVTILGLVRECILRTPNVLRIDSLDYTLKDRVMTITVVLTSTYGEIEIGGVNIG